MNAFLDPLLDYACQVLGTCELAEDCTWEHRMSTVLRIRDSSGVTWFLKAHRDPERYHAELTAYRRWVPALRDNAPRLRAFDDSLQAMVLSPVPGQPPGWPAEPAVHREAGKILRLLHEAQPGFLSSDFAAVKLTEFDALEPAATGLLRPRELHAARAEIETLAGIPAPVLVPCHHDYTPRNWLVLGGAVHVIDFEWSGLDVWVADLARLHLGIWVSRPDLQQAFLEGYGQDLGGTDRRLLHGCAVLTAVWLVVKAHETRQPDFEEASRTALLRLIGGPARR